MVVVGEEAGGGGGEGDGVFRGTIQCDGNSCVLWCWCCVFGLESYVNWLGKTSMSTERGWDTTNVPQE